MKIFLLILLFPSFLFAQFRQDEKISVKARVISDSGTINGYFVTGADSTVILSTTKRYSPGTTMNIPVNSIREMRIRNKPEATFGIASGVFVLGFIVTAGLTKNSGDVNNDGKTSFFELLYTAIEGSTSGNRRRRNTALIAGAVGGTAFTLIALLSNRKLSLVFPISNRKSYYEEKRGEINKYVGF
jgi:hypothetical protein